MADREARGDSHWKTLTSNERPSETQQTIGRDLDEISGRLIRWLDKEFGAGKAGIAALSAPSASGGSSELFLVDFKGDLFATGAAVTRTVIKLQPRFWVYPVVDLVQQYRCMEIASGMSRAVSPRPYRLEQDPEFLGAPFIVMERRPGRGCPDFPSYQTEGWIVDLTPEERTTLWCNGIRAIADLHAIDISGGAMNSLELPADGGNALERAVAYWRRYLDFMQDGWDFPVLQEAVSWLEKNRPAGTFDPGFVWGDASLRNILFTGLDPSGLMDFEFAHLGLREFDIVFYAEVDRILAEGYAERPRLSGFLSVDETCDFYESLTGRTVRHRRYFTVMAATYNTLATTRVFTRWSAVGQMDPVLVRTNPSLRLLARLIGADPPR